MKSFQTLILTLYMCIGQRSIPLLARSHEAFPAAIPYNFLHTFLVESIFNAHPYSMQYKWQEIEVSYILLVQKLPCK